MERRHWSTRISLTDRPFIYKSPCAGSGSEGAQTNLQESYSDSFTLQEAETLALSTLKQVGVAVARKSMDALPVCVCGVACLPWTHRPPYPHCVGQVMEEKISADFVEVASVTKEGYKSYNKAETEAILARI